MARATLAVAGLFAVVTGFGLAGCGGDDKPEGDLPKAPPTLRVASTAFGDGGTIPRRFTCDGANVSPPLAFPEVPEGARQLALVVYDLDADNFVHWSLVRISPGTALIRAGRVPPGAVQTKNSFGDEKYGGPCPPEGDNPHRYVFALYALSKPLDVDADTSPEDVRIAIAGAATGRGTLTGSYGR
jgi:Raf kinase inhibitor-like YbhB/YbcL family protein